MAQGYFNDDELTTPLVVVVQNQGTFAPRSGSGTTADNDIGMLRFFATSFIPGGYMADGSPKVGALDPGLAMVEGGAYGTGANGQTFNLPDLQGRVIVGSGPSTLGTASGTDTVQVTSAQFPASLGGQSAPVSFGQPSLALQYLICVSGPDPYTGRAPQEPFLGEIVAFTGNYVPPGFLPADGRYLSTKTYQTLYATLARFGQTSDGSAFALPNLRGRDIVGANSNLSTGLQIGTVVGQSSAVLSQANLPVANGGSGQGIADQAPGLALYYVIDMTDGLYPSPSNLGGALSTQPYIGEVRAMAGNIYAVPTGWAIADGRSLSIREFPALFSLLGNTYGGDGFNTFNLPHLVGRSVVGTGTRNGVVYREGTYYGDSAATLVVTDPTPCFCAGTLIATPGGEVAVEGIRAGDTVLTAGGAERRVRWVGHRSHAGRFLRANPRNWPVRFAAGSLGGGLPRRDLLVSQDHAMLLNGMLVPARCLVNGSTIRVQHAPARADYHHIELDSHDAVLAEGAASETFLDDGSRGLYGTLAAGAPPAPTEFCAPRAVDGPALDALRRKLDNVAAEIVRAA